MRFISLQLVLLMARSFQVARIRASGMGDAELERLPLIPGICNDPITANVRVVNVGTGADAVRKRPGS
jgi:hypothetical protein